MSAKVQVFSFERGYRVLREGVALADYQIRYPSAIKVRKPSDQVLESMAWDGVAEAVDGCESIEPDGECEHSYPSWLRALGYI